MHSRRYLAFGALFGLLFPVAGSLIQAALGPAGLSAQGLAAAQGEPLLWIIWTAPFFLGPLAMLAGRRQDLLAAAESARREEYLATAGTLVAAAQSLLTSVGAFSGMTAQTAASVRQATATMGHLGQAATQAALTAETVIGLARQGARTSAEGLASVETSQGEMTGLAEEVRALSDRIAALDARLRETFALASVVSYLADRSRRLADQAAERAGRAGPDGGGLGELVAEMNRHAEDGRRAAAQAKEVLAGAHQAMVAASAAAQAGLRRAEQGVTVAAATGDTIRRLAGALDDSSGAAREIATVAQQQDHGIEEVLRAMNEIYLATQEAMRSTQAVAAEAQALNDLASGLKRSVE